MSNPETKKGDVELVLQLGDVIQITNPVNEILNNQTFIIDYIDNTKVYLIDTETFQTTKLTIDNDGILGDGNITKIEILSRADTPSYARQNGLLPGKWINIYFGGDFPVIITGEITNLEKDMIELRTMDKDILYINFDYKGIPEDLPIDNIEIREKPTKPLTPIVEPEIDKEEMDKEDKVVMDKELEEGEIQEDMDIGMDTIEKQHFIPTENIQINIPVKNVKDQLREFILKADQIVFGDEELGKMVQYVDVSTQSQRYSIEVQVSDLLDDLLSTIPNAERTPRVLNNIHITIERFKQLREMFSTFDQYGNVDGILKNKHSYKPLKEWLQSFNVQLYWILPVVKNIKKVYDVDSVDEENNDVITIELSKDIKELNQTISTLNASDADNNRYSSLYSEINDYFIPFNLVDDENQNNIMIEKEVQTNITTIIDNLEDMYSTVFSNNALRNRRFVISKYNLGESKLDTIDSNSSKMTTIRVPMTNNDVMSIKSIVTLPEPAVHFSKVGLPGSDILTKSNLNAVFIEYWRLLKKKTIVNNTFIDSLENEINFDENTFVGSVRNFILNLSSDQLQGKSKLEIYNEFANIIIPKTRVIFNLMKKYIKGKLSIIDVVSYLEPFLIYTEDLSVETDANAVLGNSIYQDITEFIDKHISEYNRNKIELSRVFKIIANVKPTQLVKSQAFSMVDIINANMRNDVFDTGYQLENPESVTNSELLKRLTVKDYSRLYTSSIAYQNLKLMFPQDITELFDAEQKQKHEKLKDAEKEDKCSTITVAKMYTSLEQLNQDNDKVIYFDKQYDKTNYGVMEESSGYAKEVIQMTPEHLKDHIIQNQIKKNGLSESDAVYLADTLINGVKRVIDGQYAILYKGYSENVKDESEYYIRKHDTWVLDKELNKDLIRTDESSILCDIQDKCISIPTKSGDKCESMETNELALQNSLLTNIISEFDTKYKVSKEEFETNIKTQYEYFMSIMPILAKIETNALLKYNNQRFKIGMTLEDDKAVTTTVISPFSDLLNVILSQTDFVKKQNDIIKFCDKFTRTSLPGFSLNGKEENEYWLYCVKSSTPLIPTFKKTLAAAYITSPYIYTLQLEKIKSSIGQLSDDGNWWTDKYTGWAICPGDYDVDEGYDDGFKVRTRAIMEEDAGANIIAPSSEKRVKYITMESIMINNVVNALSVAMGINIEIQKEFIINSVSEMIRNNVESESSYKEKLKTVMQKGKTLPSYRDFYNASLLYYTLGMYLIAVQTMIPSIKTRKTHPGCVRSFTGYPFDGMADLSSLTYLACVTHDIRDSGEPWNVLKRMNVDRIQARIKDVIDGGLIQLPEVQRKFAEKTEYLLTSLPSDIPEEHDISQWTDFLPPLLPFKIRHLTNISDEFKRRLVSDLRSGSETQREKILVVESKIIQFSLAIQEKIQDIVRKHKVLLHASNNEPYLENACCDSKDNEPTIEYFTNRDKEIIEYNNIVTRLSNMLEDIQSNTKSQILSSNINTKNVYPPISNVFDEKTIYLAFIFYCKFKSLMPIPEDLLAVCTNKPDSSLLQTGDSIDRMIQLLKEDGRNYTNQQFLRLIQLISRENIVPIELDHPIISCVANMSALLESIYDENNESEMVDQSLRDLIQPVLFKKKEKDGDNEDSFMDIFDMGNNRTPKEVIQLNNFLNRTNDEMKQEIIDFIQKNSGTSVTRNALRKCMTTINTLSEWTIDQSKRNEDIKISNDATYNIIQFYKSFISNFVKIFPTIILNKVDYKETSIPKYYGFSMNHVGKLKKFIEDYFKTLTPFYNDEVIINLLNRIQLDGKNMIRIAIATPCFSSIKIGDKTIRGIIDEQTGRYLFEYYLLRVLIHYIELSDDDDMVFTGMKKTIESDTVYTVEYGEDLETGIDLAPRNIIDTNNRILTGNKRDLKQHTAGLLVTFIEILNTEKEMVDISYEDVQDRIFKLKEREKDMVTDKLKGMTDESREVDTILKICKLAGPENDYSKGLKKGLTTYDADYYDDKNEQNLRLEMEKAERKIRKKNRDATDENINILVDEYMDEQQMVNEIEADAYGMDDINEDYMDGNYEELEYDDYADYD